MALTLTKEALASAYDYLCEFQPFASMNMPHSEDVHFSISRRKDRFAHYQMLCGEHHIVLSSRFVGRHMQLLQTLAHEMAHLYLEQNCIDDGHGPGWQKLADKICKHHPEFDRLNF